MIGRFLSAALVVAMSGTYSAAAAPAPPGPAKITWQRDGLLTWERVERRPIAPRVVHEHTSALAPGHSKVLAAGTAGVLELWVRYAQRDGGPVRRIVLGANVLRAPKTRIVAEGIGESPLSEFEERGVAQMAYIARSAMLMVATAYTAESAGGGGVTAIGRRAGHGIVAVDPRVIPLGTRLYIPGYGVAIAGDTGGAIVGHRIDLGFDSLRDAMLFGRRDITVYRLK